MPPLGILPPVTYVAHVETPPNHGSSLDLTSFAIVAVAIHGKVASKAGQLAVTP